jgi:rare lipoprotein A
VNSRVTARASFRFAVLAACLLMTGTAYAATAGTAAEGGGTSTDQTGRAAAKVVPTKATRHVREGSKVRVRGALQPGRGGRTVRLQRRSGNRWLTVDRARTGSGGRFTAAWKADSQGSYKLRIAFAGDEAVAKTTRPLRGKVNVYRPSAASWYGPGFYGRRTACGQTISSSIMGVANKSLPCGTRVTMRYHGRSVTVPVIDRGPYSGSREWDLTPATKNKLGFGSTGTVWVTK